ncbi:hypothetical protein COT40_02070 [Candidatus Peregrinibacteria bacterium CG08_land_8_20_14_0_20_41_10]|nr:MAG: hypothetical protein COT40_02070 [Candidatus Peregrinibacteria bacterium CG08_land_8_20_14_0_20_41_10]
MSFSDEENLLIGRLVERAQQGDQNAFAELYELLFNPLYKFVSFKAPREETEDLVSEIFLKTWQNLSYYKKLEKNFTAWFFRLAQNTIIDFYRTRKETSPLEELLENASEEDGPAEITIKEFSRQTLEKALGKIKVEHREVITLRFISGFSHHEIAEILNKKEGAIRTMQYRALKELRKIMGVKNI